MPSLITSEKNLRCKHFFVRIFLSLFLALTLVSIQSCSSHSEGASFTSRLDEVDAFISAGDFSGAVKLLEDVSKEAYSVYSRLGVYKRYMLLGESERAEKVLVKGLKKLPHNPELSAVYADFLLRQNRLREAVRVSACLSGTEYGSFYSEAVLRLLATGTVTEDQAFNPPKRQKKNQQVNVQPQMYHQMRFVPLYADAYKAAGDWRWMGNALTLCMINGDTEQALSLRPRALHSLQEKLLWSFVLYDTERYAECLEVLLTARDALHITSSTLASPIAQSPSQRESVATYFELNALLADVYYILGSDDASEVERTKLIAELSQVSASLLPDSFAVHVMPLVYLNSIAHARAQNNALHQYQLLEIALEDFSSNRDVLAAFGQFALDTASRPPEDELLVQLREAGLRTQAMEEADKVPNIALEEALSYVDTSLEQKRDVSLVVLREELSDASNASERKEVKIAHAWKLLEREETGTNSYPPEVLSYALSRLLDCGSYDDARDLFFRTLYASLGQDYDLQTHPEQLSLWQAEYAAYFAGCDGNAKLSRTLYAYIADTFANRTATLHSAGQNESVVNALVNLALIQASCSEDTLALQTLNKASAKTRSFRTKAEILYRLALLHRGLGDKRNALRSLQYALSLNPSLGKARLLLKELEK